MIKSEIKTHEEEVVYPCLMISKVTDAVVLFSEESRGIVVKEGNNPHEIVGYYSEIWKMDMFNLLSRGTKVTLSNK